MQNDTSSILADDMPKVSRTKHRSGIWETLTTPEERTAYAKLLRSKVKPENLYRGGRHRGIPNGWQPATFARALDRAKIEADLAVPSPTEPTPSTDTILATEALRALVMIAHTPGPESVRLAAARTYLTFTRARPPGSVPTILAAQAYLQQLSLDRCLER